MAHEMVDKVRAAGVVGAGGAGFPAHVKLDAEGVDTYIANAAECEPLLCKDQELMVRYPKQLLRGLQLAMRATGARRGVIAIKKKYTRAVEALERWKLPSVELVGFENFYPAGDEYLIVYDVTGRLIPPQGIPLQVGCAVNNVETLINVAWADEGRPVTHTALTVAGAVERPVSLRVPVGTSRREVLALAGGPTMDEPALLDGGAMMGRVVFDLDEPVTKTTGGFIVLPRDHKLVRRKGQPMAEKVSISRSACDQCSYCTELCPRYLLGYAIEPHKVMRSVGFEGDREAYWARMGLQCCECSVCDLYACPEDLPPKDMCVRSKQLYRERKDALPAEPLEGLGRPHPMRDGRRIPIPRLTRRLGLTEYDVHAPMLEEEYEPALVRIPLSQHVGAPATPVVGVGERVAAGQVVGELPEGALGARVHASIDGTVTALSDGHITIER